MIYRFVSAAVATTILGFSTSALSQGPTESEAADFVQRFCQTLVPDVAVYDPNAPGVWPTDDPAVFGPLATPELAAAIEEALARNAAFEDETGGKGLLGDGVPWTSVQDAASACTAGSVAGTPERPEVEIHYRYADAPDMGWVDTIILARYEQEWRVDDIEYGNDGSDFSLRTALAQAIDQQ
ncbi:hypothetical protein [Pelagibacterium sp. H642]|uniref:hypothetical protein n=1 Tax=Pelagibacterium sp. H642 TaxID=1881069 RepID=UPI0028158638|nr:hypothetical protein [Pelagibacterium sp. H642]WMT91963.1 hypothetical protein NO934_06825 [Pelagibacterium sp. H642]